MFLLENGARRDIKNKDGNEAITGRSAGKPSVSVCTRIIPLVLQPSEQLRNSGKNDSGPVLSKYPLFLSGWGIRNCNGIAIGHSGGCLVGMQQQHRYVIWFKMAFCPVQRTNKTQDRGPISPNIGDGPVAGDGLFFLISRADFPLYMWRTTSEDEEVPSEQFSLFRGFRRRTVVDSRFVFPDRNFYQ